MSWVFNPFTQKLDWAGSGTSFDPASPGPIGATTPAAGTFTTLTATGQTSLGGVLGSEGLRVNAVAGSNTWLDVTGSNTSRVDVTALGPAGTNVALRLSSRGSEPVRIFTVAQTAEQFRVSSTASAVNYVQVTGATTGNNPTISSQGSDATRGLAITTKGASGVLDLQTGGTSRIRVGQSGTGIVDIGISASGGIGFQVSPTTSQVNFIQATGSIAGSAPILSAQGSDTNIDLTLTPKGTGTVKTSGTGVQLVGSTSGYVGLKGAAAAGSTTYTFPAADGTSGQVLSTNGSGVMSWATASVAKQTNVFTVADNATYTAPANTQWVKVTCVGSGGGATGVTGRRCTGGGGGGVAIKWLAMTAGQTLTYNLLGGGAATVSSGTLTITTITGGAGGAGTTTVYANSVTYGPAGGAASGGDININGDAGGNSYGSSTTVATNFSGAGGNCPGFGSGGSGVGATAASGSAGTGYGGGGGGSHGINSNASGAQGVIIFEAY